MAGTIVIGYNGTLPVSGTADISGTASVGLTYSKLQIAPSGFSYKTGDDLQWTTFDLVSTTTDEVFRQEIWKLDYLRDKALRWGSDASNSEPVNLFWTVDGETVGRRSVVNDISYEVNSEEVLNANLGIDAAKVRLAVQHNPYWESTLLSSFAGTVSDLGGTIVIPLTDTNYPSRIKYLNLTGWAGDEFWTTRTKAWAGIRDYRNGVSGFIPVWEAEAGTNGTDTASTADANARGGTVKITSFATTTTMAKRFDVKWSQVATANYDHLTGHYLVLGRMKLSAGTVECAAELRHGWLGEAGLESSLGVTYLSAVTNPELVNFNLVPLGIAEIPPTGDREAIASGDGGASSPMKSYGLALYAERLSGAGSMSFDCFVLIPADHLFIASQTAIHSSNGSSTRAYTGNDDINYAIKHTIANLYGNIEYSFENWNVPAGGGVMVLAAQSGTIHLLSGTITASGDYYKRFRSYRGTA